MGRMPLPPTPFQRRAIIAANLLKRNGKAPTAAAIAFVMSGGVDRKRITATGVGVAMANAQYRGLVERVHGEPPEWHPLVQL